MAESEDKATKSAEQAYAAAAAAAQPAASELAAAEAAPVTIDQPVTSEAPVEAPVAPKAKAAKPAPARKPAAAKAKTKAKGAKPEPATPTGKKPAAQARRKFSQPRRVPAPKAQPAPATTPVPTIAELKDKIMATAKTADFTKPLTDAVSEMQTKAKAAYDKGTELATEMTEFAKGNVEALVESTKVYAAGVQDLSKTYVEEAKSAYETLTADMKELAAVKSPAELFQLQGKLARRNFEALVAMSSKNTEAMTRLASESFAPISGRISLAAEKIAKAA